MSCGINAAGFAYQYANPISGCSTSVSNSSTIEAMAVVGFDQANLNQGYYCIIKGNFAGSNVTASTPTWNVTSTTWYFTINIANFGIPVVAGTYSISYVEVRKASDNSLICSGNLLAPVGALCSPLTLTSGTSGGIIIDSISFDPANPTPGTPFTIQANCHNSSSVTVTDTVTFKIDNIAICSPSITIPAGLSGATSCSANVSQYKTYNICAASSISSKCVDKAFVCSNPKYKCSGTSCISDNCDGSGSYTDPSCNGVCNPSCTNPKYKCSGSSCISDNCDGSGIWSDGTCGNSCVSTGGGGCTNCDLTTNICIFGSCQNKNLVYAAGGFFVLMLLMR